MANWDLYNKLKTYYDTWIEGDNARALACQKGDELKKLLTKPEPVVLKPNYEWLGSLSAYALLTFATAGWPILGFILMLIFPHSFEHPFYTAMAILLVLDIIIWIFERRPENKKIKEENKKLIAQNQKYVDWWNANQANIPVLQNEIANLQAQERSKKQQAANYAQSIGLHPSYQDYNIVDHFISYLEKGKCDTLKECINMYERDMAEYHRQNAEIEHQYRMRQKLDDMAATQAAAISNVQAEAERATNAAAKAAGLSAASAFISWNSAEQQRKRDQNK